MGIKLLGYQKKLLDMLYKGQAFIQTRNPHKKYETYLRLMLSYINMDEDATIAIVNYPNDLNILGKEEFREWLNSYW